MVNQIDAFVMQAIVETPTWDAFLKLKKQAVLQPNADWMLNADKVPLELTAFAQLAIKGIRMSNVATLMNALEMHVEWTPFVLILLEASTVAVKQVTLEIHLWCAWALKEWTTLVN